MKKKGHHFKQPSVAVFGGSGFLGSHVCDALTERGYKVRIFDRVASPYLQKGQQMMEGDILDRASVYKAVRGCDYVYNFAGIADMDDAGTKPLDTSKYNIIGNINIIDACLEAKVERFVYASTIYVYSERGGFYRCSKQASELYIEEYQRKFGLDFTILRYGTLYGPRADSRNSVYRYLKSALAAQKILYPGSGEEIRDYIHVRDAARLSVDVLSESFRNQHIIISGHHPIRFKDLAQIVEEILGKKITIKTIQQQNSGHYNYTPYSFIPKIGNKLTGQVYVDLGQGLLECLHQLQNNTKY